MNDNNVIQTELSMIIDDDKVVSYYRDINVSAPYVAFSFIFSDYSQNYYEEALNIILSMFMKQAHDVYNAIWIEMSRSIEIDHESDSIKVYVIFFC